MSSSDDLYFRQLLAGRDFARENVFAARMMNFCYLVGDRASGEALVVDPAWDVRGLMEAAESDGMRVTGALVTHYHPDHVGGEILGHEIEGLSELLSLSGMKVHVHEKEAAGVQRVTGLSPSDLAIHSAGDLVKVGSVAIQLLHTPGHTPGSQCFLVRDRLVSGDTLFVQGCGRVDLPGGDAEEMYRTLTERLAKLGDEVVLFPGHHYANTVSSTMKVQREANYALRMRSLNDWMRLMGAG